MIYKEPPKCGIATQQCVCPIEHYANQLHALMTMVVTTTNITNPYMRHLEFLLFICRIVWAGWIVFFNSRAFWGYFTFSFSAETLCSLIGSSKAFNLLWTRKPTARAANLSRMTQANNSDMTMHSLLITLQNFEAFTLPGNVISLFVDLPFLFCSDHGFDCICTLAHLATVSSYVVCGGTYWYILLQTTLQFAFFMAQWEEYFTHVLPHCAGKVIGVTEVNYSLGILALANSLIDREAFYSRPMSAVLGEAFGRQLPIFVRELELRHFLMTGWGIMSAVLMILSIRRVIFHPRVAKPSYTTVQRLKQQVNALSKLATPFALCVGGFLIPPTSVRTRYLSVTMGLAFSLITKKMIVYGMAKMAFAVVQWDAVPFLLAAIWIRYDDRLTREGADFVLGVLCFWYTWRMLRWVHLTIYQICDRLDINCFTIKKRKIMWNHLLFCALEC